MTPPDLPYRAGDRARQWLTRWITERPGRYIPPLVGGLLSPTMLVMIEQADRVQMTLHYPRSFDRPLTILDLIIMGYGGLVVPREDWEAYQHPEDTVADIAIAQGTMSRLSPGSLARLIALRHQPPHDGITAINLIEAAPVCSDDPQHGIEVEVTVYSAAHPEWPAVLMVAGLDVVASTLWAQTTA